MSLEQQWKNLGAEGDDDLSALLTKPDLHHIPSRSPLQRIKRALYAHLWWCVIIDIFYLYLIFTYHQWQVQVCLTVTFLFTTWGLVTGRMQYLNIVRSGSYTQPVLDELKRHHASISAWIRSVHRAAIFVYPIAAAGGFMLGGTLGSGRSVAEFLSKPVVAWALVITIIVLVPLCVLLARWMTRRSFGTCLNALKQNIDDLESQG